MLTATRATPQDITHVTAAQMRRALISGMRRVVNRREWLDRINVFPVPDGDTGSNLAFTLNTVMSAGLCRRCHSVGALMRSVADAAVDGARGNSGAILAQFFSGVSQALAGVDTVTPPLLARATQVGASAACGALSDPREGTIISVIRAFADAWVACAGSVDNLRAGFSQALEQARRALARTPEQLPVLKQAGVVDAGAQGFIDMLEGIAEYVDSGRLSQLAVSHALADIPFAGEDLHDTVDTAHRWCSECLVSGADLQAQQIRDALDALDAISVVVAGGAEKLRVHAHVGAPARMFERLREFGKVSAIKADDMLAQQTEASQRQAVAVVTDSGADIPEALQQRLGIHMVPVRVSFGDEDFLDKVSLSAAEFHRRLREGSVFPKTSQPPSGDFRRQFEISLSHHAQVVCVGLSRALSGTLQAAESAAARVDSERVHVVDSGHASCGQALLAVLAAELARAGADAPKIREQIALARGQVQTWAITRDVSFAVRGGRIPAWAKPLIAGLGLVPVARVKSNGRLGVAGALLGGVQAAPLRFARYLRRRMASNQRWRVLIGHVGCEGDAELLRQALLDGLQVEDLGIVEVGPAIGAHAGTGALVVAIQSVEVASAGNAPDA
jgi:DegV family protein with EDD domain